jgi:uncharacterized protein (DUF58 family)
MGSRARTEPDAAVVVTLAPLLAQRFAARALDLPGARRVAGAHAGPHSSRFRGRGVDYLESRAYHAGDDIRNMDWRVTARSGRAHTKLFQEERERSVLLVLDHAASMRFGTRRCFKSVQAAQAAALLAWAATRGGDRVGAIAFGSGLDAEIRPGGGPRGVLHCLRALTQWDATAHAQAASSSLADALERTRRLARPGSFTVVLTDGFSADAAAAAPLSKLAQHGDVAVILLSDPLELAAPPPGRYAVLADGARRLFEFAGTSRDHNWIDAFATHRQVLVTTCKRLGVPLLPLSTADQPARVLAGLVRAFAPQRRPR